MRPSSSAIGRLEKDILPRLKREAEAVLEGANVFTARAHSELQEVSDTLRAHERSEKLLEDNRNIVRTLAEGLPPYVAKVRDVQTDFEEFDRNFPKLEETVKLYHRRSKKTADDIDALRQQLGTLTQRQEAFSKLSIIVPALVALVACVMWYAVRR